jgi:hypothetical protein
MSKFMLGKNDDWVTYVAELPPAPSGLNIKDRKSLSDSDLVVLTRSNLTLMEVEDSVAGIQEIFHRAKSSQSELVGELLVGALLVSTIRSAKMGVDIVRRACPVESQNRLTIRIVVEFIDCFTLKEITEVLESESVFEIVTADKRVVWDCLIKLVMAESEAAFFYFVERLGAFDFNFDLSQCGWVAFDQSGYSHGPMLNVAHVRELGGDFLEVAVRRGTEGIKRWAFSKVNQFKNKGGEAN